LLEFPDEQDREALLFGMAGMLADSTRQPILPVWETRLKQLWDRWWNLGATRLELPWNHCRTRPYNSPCRRLAAGIAWLRHVRYAPAKWLRECAEKAHDVQELKRCLLDFQLEKSLWNGCTDFCHEVRPEAALLGRPRLMDIAGNVYLPYLSTLELPVTNQPDKAALLARELYMLLPRSEDNRLLKEAYTRFFMPPSRSREVVDNLSRQQGLLDIYHHFCLSLNMDCMKCPMAKSIDNRR